MASELLDDDHDVAALRAQLELVLASTRTWVDSLRIAELWAGEHPEDHELTRQAYRRAERLGRLADLAGRDDLETQARLHGACPTHLELDLDQGPVGVRWRGRMVISLIDLGYLNDPTWARELLSDGLATERRGELLDELWEIMRFHELHDAELLYDAARLRLAAHPEWSDALGGPENTLGATQSDEDVFIEMLFMRPSQRDKAGAEADDEPVDLDDLDPLVPLLASACDPETGDLLPTEGAPLLAAGIDAALADAGLDPHGDLASVTADGPSPGGLRRAQAVIARRLEQLEQWGSAAAERGAYAALRQRVREVEKALATRLRARPRSKRR